tara:strand:+ start:221 stop:910 length:690 start_codon:yes stop_codon:yes gene_type:complete
MIRASYVLTGSIAVAFAVSGILGTPSTPRIKHTNSFTYFVPSASILVPTTLFGGTVTIKDTDWDDIVYTVTKPLADTASISEAPAFSFTRSAFTDSVTVTEAKIIATTSTVDTDLSDADVDTDPVSVSEASVLTIQPAFSDTPIISESPAFTFSKGMPGGSITPSEAAVYTFTKVSTDSTTPSEAAVYASTKVATDSTTPSEAFSVTYLYTDTSDRTINGHYFNETPIR